MRAFFFVLFFFCEKLSVYLLVNIILFFLVLICVRNSVFFGYLIGGDWFFKFQKFWLRFNEGQEIITRWNTVWCFGFPRSRFRTRCFSVPRNRGKLDCFSQSCFSDFRSRKASDEIVFRVSDPSSGASNEILSCPRRLKRISQNLATFSSLWSVIKQIHGFRILVLSLQKVPFLLKLLVILVLVKTHYARHVSFCCTLGSRSDREEDDQNWSSIHMTGSMVPG